MMEDWTALEERVRRGHAPRRAARRVLREFSSSFFLVTRFLPAAKRAKVEMIYAAVRYPDEVVDTFPLSAAAKCRILDRCEAQYGEAVHGRANEAPWILAGFANVVREHEIPHEHYRSFLDAMRRDADPRRFQDLADLIDNYIYGSAIVVGYFLAHVYGCAKDATLQETYRSAATLGIALQLTNFCRDVAEDRGRGRLYLPVELVEAYGEAGAVTILGEEAEVRYAEALATVGVFAPDTRPAIHACIDVYGRLNRRILRSGGEIGRRHSVPVSEKLRALPSDKYWRLPLAYLGVL
jgi:phytoene synthase